jgi:hypothetical protein
MPIRAALLLKLRLLPLPKRLSLKLPPRLLKPRLLPSKRLTLNSQTKG